MLKEIFRGINRIGRGFGVYQLEISTYNSVDSPIHPRAAFAEQWNFKKMDLPTFQKISRHFSRAQWLSFSGWGEPLENEHIVSMVRSGKQANCLISLHTNGFHLPELSAALLQEGVDLVVISLELDNRGIQDNLQEGTEFKRTLDNVEALVQLRKELRRNRPFIKLSFPMTRLNMRELPGVVPIAADLGVEEVMFIHLDYLPDERWNILRAFYHESPTPAFQESIDEIRRLGRELGVGIRTYPLKTQEEVICEDNPLRNVFFAVDGAVAPCSFLRIPKKGDIPRIFMNKGYRVPQTFFGNIQNEDFLEIWNREPYRRFREVFESRTRAATDESGAMPPLAETCRTCYRTYGI